MARLRLGFVSNSSSSSFIIAFKRDSKECCPTCGCSGFSNILDLVEKLSYNSDDNHVCNTGYEEIKEYIESLFGEDGNYLGESEKENLRQVKKQLPKLKKEGWEVALISLSNHEDTIKDIMTSSQNIKVLHRECY